MAEEPRNVITVLHLRRSRSERVIWLLEELGIPYDLRVFDRRPDVYAPEALKAAHPLGKAPVIDDDGTVLGESGAIVEYVLARYGDGRLAVGPDAPNFARYLYWLHFAEGSLMLQLARELSVDRMLPNADAHPGMVRLRDGTRAHLALVEDALAETAYLAGDSFTAADLMMAFPFTTFRDFRPIDLTPYPAITAWVARLERRPAFIKALAA